MKYIHGSATTLKTLQSCGCYLDTTYINIADHTNIVQCRSKKEKNIKEWFEERDKEPKALNWPPNPPDPNPIDKI